MRGGKGGVALKLFECLSLASKFRSTVHEHVSKKYEIEAPHSNDWPGFDALPKAANAARLCFQFHPH